MALGGGRSGGRGRPSSTASAPRPQITQASDERIASNAINGINILIDLL